MAGWSTSVACAEIKDSVDEEYTDKGIVGKVTLEVDWTSRHALVAEIVGARLIWPHAIGATPFGPRAQSAAIKSDGAAPTGIDADGKLVYQKAHVTIKYGMQATENAYSEELEPTIEFIRLDYKRFRWGGAAGAPLLEDEAPGFQSKGLNLSRTIYNVDAVPASALTLMGASNDADYTSDILGLTFAAETLLFQPPTMNRSIKTDGSGAWTLNVKFPYKPQGWNKFYRAETGDWEAIHRAGELAAYKSYPPDDFSDWLA